MVASRLVETKSGVCVSTVSIVGGRDGRVHRRVRCHQIGRALSSSPMLLTIFSGVARILMILLPGRPRRQDDDAKGEC